LKEIADKVCFSEMESLKNLEHGYLKEAC